MRSSNSEMCSLLRVKSGINALSCCNIRSLSQLLCTKALVERILRQGNFVNAAAPHPRRALHVTGDAGKRPRAFPPLVLAIGVGGRNLFSTAAPAHFRQP